MVIAHCTRCLGKAQGETFEVASSKINHAVSLSRGIPCGDNYNCVEELKEALTKQSPKEIAKVPNVVISDPPKEPFKPKKSKKQY
jgi:hypothetical protein